MEYAYVRVSTAEQEVGRQLVKMEGLGIPSDRVYIDHASGKDMERPAWKALMAVVRPGDSIVLDSLDRLGRSYDDVTREWRRLTREVGCDLRALDLDFFDSARFREMGAVGVCVEDMLLSLLAYVAQTEREKNRQRQAEGIALAKERGAYRGKAPKAVTDEQAAMAIVAREGGASWSDVAALLGVSRQTVDRMRRDGRLCA